MDIYESNAGNDVSVLSLTAANCSWQVSSLSETKAHQVMQQKATSFIQFNQRQLSRIYPSSYRVDSSNFNPQPFWNAGCQLGMSTTQPTLCFMITVVRFTAQDSYLHFATNFGENPPKFYNCKYQCSSQICPRFFQDQCFPQSCFAVASCNSNARES